MSDFFDFENNQVQKELTGASFVKGESTLIAAGPPFLNSFVGSTVVDKGIVLNGAPGAGSATPGGFMSARMGGIPVFPMGVIENANIAQSKSLRRIAEVGSKRFHFVTGRTLSQLSIARVLFHGPSLLRVLYAYMGSDRFSEIGASNFTPLLDSADNRNDDIAILSAPGYKDFFINLDSSMFDMPFGLMFYMEDSRKNPYGAFYCTECYIQTHQFNVGASADVIAEGVTIQFDRAIPIDIGATSAGE